MQDPNTPDPGEQVGGTSSPAADTTSPPEPASPAVVEAETPPLGTDAVAEAVEVPPAEDLPVAEPTAGEPATGEPAVPESESAADEQPSAGTTVEDALGASDEPVAEASGEPAAEPVAEAADEPVVEAAEAVEEPAAEPVAEPVGETAAEVVDEPPVEAEVLGDVVEPVLAGTIGAPVAEVAGEVADEGTGEAPPTEATEGLAEVADESVAVPPAGLEEVTGTPEEVPAPGAEAAEEPEAEPVGSSMVFAEPATVVPQPQGVWTEEQVEAFRTRLREVTANVVDRAAGAVIETVNMVAALIRSRTSSDRRGEDRRG